MKRKCIIPLLIASMVSVALASCGNSSSQASSAPAAETESAQDSSRIESAIDDASKEETAGTDSKAASENVESSTESVSPTATPAPEEPDYSDAYAAYLQILQENKDMIAAYTWQDESYTDDQLTYGTVYPVAFADVYGDATPELLFMRATGTSYNDTYFIANLVVCTYEDSMIKTLYDENLDMQVAGGTNYCIFLGKDRSLYRYDSIGDEGWTYNYSCLTGADGTLSVADKIYQNTYPDDSYENWIDTYYHNDAEINKEEYENIKRSYYDNLDKILLSGDNDDEVLIPYTEEHGSEAMTYDEAVQKLTELSNGAAASSDTGSTSGSNADNADVFKNMSERSFYFASGVGGWGTEFEIMDDGVFSGNYHDSNMGETGDGYPNGTVYTCDFMGRFEITDKINDVTYRMKLAELTTENPVGEEWIDDEILYIASEPYGIAGGEEFLLYLPGTPTSELTDDALMWYKSPRAIGDDETVETLPCYGIYNVKTGEAFFSG